MTMRIRYTNHIEEDLKRGWSSWEFGQDGFRGTLDEFIEKLGKRYGTLSWSELEYRDLEDQAFGELYPNYWVWIDTVNCCSGCISTVSQEFDTVEEAVAYANRGANGDGDGYAMDVAYAKVEFVGEGFVILSEDFGQQPRKYNGCENGYIVDIDGNFYNISEKLEYAGYSAQIED